MQTDEELIRLSERNPNRYCRDKDVWICPSGRQYAEPLGLYYRVRSSAGINWHFQRNMQFLEDYLRSARPFLPLIGYLVVAALSYARRSCGAVLTTLRFILMPQYYQK